MDPYQYQHLDEPQKRLANDEENAAGDIMAPDDVDI